MLFGKIKFLVEPLYLAGTEKNLFLIKSFKAQTSNNFSMIAWYLLDTKL